MRLLVTGSRTWTDRDLLFRTLDEIHHRIGITALIEGCAHGADELAGAHAPDASHEKRFGHPFEGGWAWHRGVGWQHFPAEWRRPDGSFDKAAGVKRNSRMLADSEPEMCVAFDMGTSGTADMIRKARTWGLEVVVVGIADPAEGREGEPVPTT